MNIQRNAARRLEEGIADEVAPPPGDQVPPIEEDANVDQSPVNPPSLKDGDIRVALLQLGQDSTVQAQAMMVKDNWEVVPRAHQQVTTMDSRLRDFT